MLSLSLIALSLLFPLAAAAQDTHASHEVHAIPAEILDRPVRLRRGIGTVHEKVSTTSIQAQAFYDQGLAYLHAFVWIEAARSFHQALRLDPQLAMADLGLSYVEWELNRPGEARTAFERGRELAKGSTGGERQRMMLRGLELDAIANPRDPARLTAYRRALDEGLARDPLDVELWLLRGMAEAPTPGDRGQGSPAGSMQYYQKALAIQPDSMPAHHYLTHACESAGRIDEALDHGRTFALLAPAVPHAHHMYGHNLRRKGRIDLAIAEFQTAYDLDVAYAQTERIPIEYDWHHQHNLDLLATSFQYAGQMKSAERLFRESFAIASPMIVQEFAKREWPGFLIDRGRWDDAYAAAGTMIAHPSPIVGAAGHVLAGRARLGAGRFAEAADQANIALRLLKNIPEGAGLVAPLFEELQGEFFLRTGQQDKGRAMLDGVVKKVRAQPGPDEWSQALFTLDGIARAAREAGDWAFAGRMAQEMLQHDPSYAGTHYALALVADHQGDRPTARAEFALAEKYWNRADPDLPELIELRRRLEANLVARHR
jgi:tetratricopeptide (TPR) repeat protein